MLRVVIQGTYYKDSPRYSYWSGRQKKECVYFYEYDDYMGYITQIYFNPYLILKIL